MPETISLEDSVSHGIRFTASRMDNGELRFRLMRGERNSAYGYILTVMPEDQAGWQNSHYHRSVMETYIVQEGWIGYADLMADGTVAWYVYRPGELFTTRPGQAHNVYMPAGAVIHTVKHGICSEERDWHSSPELDAFTQQISEAELLRLAGATS